MTDLTEKNLEATLLNLTKTGKPIKIKPTTWFGNPAKTAQWYMCPNCGKQSPLTLKWVDLTDEEISDIAINNPPSVHEFARAIEAKLKEKNT
jgi:RNA polymerase subunit RPABC4/transcription elongation factor Spt4